MGIRFCLLLCILSPPCLAEFCSTLLQKPLPTWWQSRSKQKVLNIQSKTFWLNTQMPWPTSISSDSRHKSGKSKWIALYRDHTGSDFNLVKTDVGQNGFIDGNSHFAGLIERYPRFARQYEIYRAGDWLSLFPST